MFDVLGMFIRVYIIIVILSKLLDQMYYEFQRNGGLKL